jgi:hypothetical protein
LTELGVFHHMTAWPQRDFAIRRRLGSAHNSALGSVDL